MLGYIAFLMMPPVCGLLFYRKKRLNIWFLRVSLLILFFCSTFRAANIGADYPGYIETFYRIIKNGSSYMENGYDLLNRLAAVFTHEHWGVAMAVNMLIFTSLYIYLKKNVDARYWPLCVFVFVADPYMYVQSTFNVLRQGCALAIMLFAVDSLKNKKWFRFLIFVLVAAQMHRSAYFVIFLLFYRIVNWDRFALTIPAVVALLLNFLDANRLLNWFLRYFNYESYAYYEASMLDNIVYTLFVFGVILFLLRYYERLTQNREHKFFVDLYIFSLCFLLLAVKNDMIYRIYIMLAVMTLPALPVVWEAVASHRWGRVSLIQIGYIGYYICFYMGYIGFLYINRNPFYIPFEFCF